MDKLLIKGVEKISGKIKISGAKNAVLPIMAATLIVPGKFRILNVPNLRDTRTMIKLLEIIGCTVKYDNVNELIVDSANCNNPSAPYELVKTMRASFYVLGPLLARFQRSEVSLPGGCAWGPRPVDFHIKALKEMGVHIDLESGNIIALGQPNGAKISFPKKSVGATGNILMAAVKAKGRTIIHNAAREPEIVALGEFLIMLGADIKGLGQDTIVINPILEEKSNVEFSVIPDRIEAGTFMMAVAATGGELKLTDVCPEHLDSVIKQLIDVGVDIMIENDSIIVKSNGELLGRDMETLEYPGFPTDLQAQYMALMMIAKGKSTIKENIYIDRFTHISELNRMGGSISLVDNVATIRGGNLLSSAPVMCTDIRASAALIIAALCAKGETEVSRIYHIDRGYENIEHKLKEVGVSIERVSG